MSQARGKNVLVTGGGGFIGSELVERLLEHGPDEIRVFDNDEQSLFQLKNRLDRRSVNVRYLLGDLRDRDRVEMAVEGVDDIFHAGAIKHVEFSEYNPFEATRTNVRGTRNLVTAALAADVDSVTAISTDKASNPTSVMGATKLVMERLVTAANVESGPDGTDFNCVRFGNVLGSTGSVVPVFLEQIRRGGPITVTNGDMTRFIMSADRAVDFILDAHGRVAHGEIIVLKMSAFRVGDLADALRERFSSTYGHDPADVEIDVVGRRPGERVHEKLISEDEIGNTYECGDTFVILPEIDLDAVEVPYDPDNSLDSEYTSADAEFLSPMELASMVESRLPATPPRLPSRRMELSRL